MYWNEQRGVTMQVLGRNTVADWDIDQRTSPTATLPMASRPAPTDTADVDPRERFDTAVDAATKAAQAQLNAIVRAQALDIMRLDGLARQIDARNHEIDRLARQHSLDVLA